MLKLKLFLCFILILCNCHYKGGYSKVEWDSINRKFLDKNIALGEELISVEFIECKKKRKKIYLKGKVFDNNNLMDDGNLSEKVIIFGIDSKGMIKDSLGVSDIEGNFVLETIKKKDRFLVFKKISKKWGIKYRSVKFK